MDTDRWDYCLVEYMWWAVYDGSAGRHLQLFQHDGASFKLARTLWGIPAVFDSTADMAADQPRLTAILDNLKAEGWELVETDKGQSQYPEIGPMSRHCWQRYMLRKPGAN